MIIASAEVLGAVNQGWITPREQLRRLIIPQLEEQGVGLGLLSRERVESAVHSILYRSRVSLPKAPPPSLFNLCVESLVPMGRSIGPQLAELGIDLERLSEERVESAVHFILNRSRGSLAGSEPEGPPSLFNLCVDSFISSPLLSSLTNWYIAIDRIGALEDKIPPLPKNIHEILESTCPIYGGSRTVGETHSLYLIPPGNLNELQQRISACGQQFFRDENPLRFRYFWQPARDEHADVAYREPQWVLISNDVLPGSRNLSYEDQVQMVADLGVKSVTDYQLPTLREAIGSMFLDKMVGDKMLYRAGNEANGYSFTLTHVKEATQNGQLLVGSFAPSGLEVGLRYSSCNEWDFGVAAVRRLSNQSGSI